MLEEPVSPPYSPWIKCVKGSYGPNFTLQQINASFSSSWILCLETHFSARSKLLRQPPSAETVEQFCSLTFISALAAERSVRLDVDDAWGTDRSVVSSRKSSVETPAPGELVYFDRRVASRVYFRWSPQSARFLSKLPLQRNYSLEYPWRTTSVQGRIIVLCIHW